MNMQDNNGFASTTISDLIGVDAPGSKGKKSSPKVKTPVAKKSVAKVKTPAKKVAKPSAKVSTPTAPIQKGKAATKLKVSAKVNAKVNAKQSSKPAARSNDDTLHFSHGRTFNRHDTKLVKSADGRIHIDQSEGVRLRCELAIIGILRHGNKGVAVSDLTAHLNENLANKYSESDIGYAVGRLRKSGLVNLRSGTGMYTATSKLYQAWKRVSGK